MNASNIFKLLQGRSLKTPANVLALAAFLVLMLTSALSTNAGELKTIKVSINDSWPDSFLDKQGVPQGFLVDILNEVAKKEDWTLDYVMDDWKSGMEKLKNGEVDLKVSVAATKQRELIYDFSTEPAYLDWANVVVSDSSIQSILDLNNRKVAITQEGFFPREFQELCAKFNISPQFVRFNSDDEVLAAVTKKQVDAGVVPHVFLVRNAQKYSVTTSPIVFSPVGVFFAAPEGKNNELLQSLDTHLKAWKKERSSIYYDLMSKWFYGEQTRNVIPAWVYLYAGTGAGVLVFLFFWVRLLRYQVRVRTAALTESEQNLAITLHSIGDAVIASDASGRVTQMNPTAERLTGWTLAEAHGHPLSAVFHIVNATTRAAVADPVALVMANGEVVGLANHTLLLARDGGEYQIADSAAPIRNATGVIVGVVLVFSDVTEKYRMEMTLRDNEARYRTLFEHAPDGLLIADPESYYLDANPGICKMLGYTRDELVGMHATNLVAQSEIQHVQPALRQIAASSSHHREWNFKRKDGSMFTAEVFVTTMPDGNLLAAIRDITERKQAEDELRRNEKDLRESQRIAHVGSWRLDVATNQVVWTEELYNMYGLDPSLPPPPYTEHMKLFTPESWERVSTALAHIMETGIPYILELKTVRKDGSNGWMWVRGEAEVDSEGKTVKIWGAAQDITERKLAEAEREKLNAQLLQAQKLEAIGTLAGGIAHDFNNILGAIVGYSEIIRDDFPPGSPSIHDINQVIKASHRAKDLVKQILAFSRQGEEQKIPVQPAMIVKEAITLLRASLPTTITINQDIDPDAGMVLADPTQIHQIVMNLSTNAFHAMEVKGGTLTISLQKKNLSQNDLATAPDLQPGTFVQLSIRDTGEGILPEIRERIFDPFFTTKEIGKGTGLGLSTVYSIVKGSGGSITCDSRLGEGTEFRIILPALEGHTVQENESAGLTPHGKEHILLIDDEEMLVELGQAMLERLGYHVTTRRNSLDALTTFQNQPDTFDLIITDQTMPGMTGVDLARRILQIRPRMPIILSTGYSSQITEDKAKAAGIKGLAFKPLAKKDIGELIRKVLDGKNS